MRAIHSLRNSPLRARRSRYASCMAFITCSWAVRRRRLREALNPWARSMIWRRPLRLLTERLTRAIAYLPNSRLTRRRSPEDTLTSPPRRVRRVLRGFLPSFRCLAPDWRRRRRPVPVTLIRFAVARLVLVFGIG